MQITAKQENPATPEKAPRFLFVDADGTLFRSDLLIESALSAVKQTPIMSLLVPFWLLKGRAYLKRRLAEIAQVDVTLLPYHSEVIEFLKNEQETGRHIVLATASDKKYADAISDHLAVFCAVLASDGITNLKGLF